MILYLTSKTVLSYFYFLIFVSFICLLPAICFLSLKFLSKQCAYLLSLLGVYNPVITLNFSSDEDRNKYLLMT